MPTKRRKISNKATLKYPYRELSIPQNEIRLLSLEPGIFDDEIRCNLHHVSLDERSEYTALSYTWGDPTSMKPISMSDFMVNVTLNLYDALQHLRDQSDLRTFWIDALCINQNDLSERGRQVLRMRDTYSQAERVEIWLGKAENDDFAAMDLVRQVGETVSNPEEILSQEWKVSYRELFGPLFEESTPEILKALNCLYRRPWWTRIWVVQEVSLANQPKAQVTCGTASVCWLDLLVTAYAIEICWLEINSILWERFPDEPLNGFGHGIRLSQCRRVGDNYQSFALLELLHQHRDCAATDPRDFIYGILGMSGDAQEMGIEPDYAEAPQKIYSDLVVKYVKATGSLDIICACRNERNFNDLPSWVPDWSTDQIVPGICINQRYSGGDKFPASASNQVERYHSAGTTRADVEFWEDGVHFSASGFIFGRILRLGIIDDGMKFEPVETFGRSGEDGRSASDSETFNDWLNLVLDSPEWNDIEKRYESPQRVLDAFCRTLVANRNQRLMRPPDYSEKTSEESSPKQVEADPKTESGPAEAAETLIEDDKEDTTSANSGANSVPDDSVMFSPAEVLDMNESSFRSCIEVSWGKRLAILDSGFIGIVPGESIEGDFVCILMGCSLPLVLRKSNPTYHKLLGESYFHGITGGELMDTKCSFETIIFE